MKIGIIGAGNVGQTFAAALAAKGHDVIIGIRKVNNEELAKERSMAQPAQRLAKNHQSQSRNVC